MMKDLNNELKLEDMYSRKVKQLRSTAKSVAGGRAEISWHDDEVLFLVKMCM